MIVDYFREEMSKQYKCQRVYDPLQHKKVVFFLKTKHAVKQAGRIFWTIFKSTSKEKI